MKKILTICCIALIACNSNTKTSEIETTKPENIVAKNTGDYIIENYTMQDIVTKINALETTCTQAQWEECEHIAKSYLEKYKGADAASKDMYSQDVDNINKSIAVISNTDSKKFADGEAGLKAAKCDAASNILYIVQKKRVTYIKGK